MSLKYVILTLVNQQPNSGYDMVKSFDRSLGHFWHASHQQVYRELANLKGLGWVENVTVAQSGKPDKKIYRITPQGREALSKWLRSPLKVERVKDEFLVRCLSPELVEPAFLCELLQSSVDLMQVNYDILVETRKNCFNFDDPADMPLLQRRMYITLRKGLLLYEAWLRWAEEAQQLLALEEAE